MITRKNEQSLECCLSSQTVSNCFKLLKRATYKNMFSMHKTCFEYLLSVLYDWIILSEIFENKPFKFVPNNREKLLNGRG